MARSNLREAGKKKRKEKKKTHGHNSNSDFMSHFTRPEDFYLFSLLGDWAENDSVIFFASGNLVFHVSPPDWRHSIPAIVKREVHALKCHRHLLWPFCSVLNWLSNLEDQNKPNNHLCRVSVHLDSPERPSSSVDLRTGMGRENVFEIANLQSVTHSFSVEARRRGNFPLFFLLLLLSLRCMSV